MKRPFFIFLGLWLVAFSALAGEMVISGVYQGKNVYVQNPYVFADKTFCTEQVFVNDRLILERPKTSAYQIDLSYLKINELVVIRIIFHDDCKPKIVNPRVLHAVDGFEFLFAEADNQSITWVTKGELPGGLYKVEQVFRGSWKILKSVEGKGDRDNNQYNIEPKHFAGHNRYRIKYEPVSGEAFYSVEFTFDSHDREITFHPKEARTKINLSEPTSYLVTDSDGNKVLEGNGKIIDLREVKRGTYLLSVENWTEEFVRR